MAYSSIVKPSAYFNTKLYSGNGGTQSITGVGFQPDWVWCKGRSFVDNHISFDAVRTATKVLKPNTTAAESTVAATLTSFDSDGFSLGSDGEINANNQTFVSWNWKANGTGSANTDGSINTIATSVNTTSGFSIVKYLGTGSAGTIGHGLTVAPKIYIIKNLSDTTNWKFYTTAIDGSLDILNLNTTDTKSDSAGTLPTNSVFSIGTNANQGANGNGYVVYCFAEKTGYSKFGSYVGNGNDDGPFIYCGFKPAWILIKNTQQGGDDWILHNNKFPGFNVNNQYLYANTTNAQIDLSTLQLDIVSNGFKIRKSTGAFNNSNEKMIYMAFAEQPLVANSGNDGVPATAR